MGQKWVQVLCFMHRKILLFQLVVFRSAHARVSTKSELSCFLPEGNMLTLVTGRVLCLGGEFQSSPCVDKFGLLLAEVSSSIIITVHQFNSVPQSRCDHEASSPIEVTFSLLVFAHHVCAAPPAPLLQDSCWGVCVPVSARARTTYSISQPLYCTQTFLLSVGIMTSHIPGSVLTRLVLSQLRALCTFAALARSCLDWITRKTRFSVFWKQMANIMLGSSANSWEVVRSWGGLV